MHRKILILKIIILSTLYFLISCGKPEPDVDPRTIDFNLTVDPDNWVLVPAGRFLSGLTEKEKVIDYDYEIMVTEVTYKQYARYLNEALSAGKIKIKYDNKY